MHRVAHSRSRCNSVIKRVEFSVVRQAWCRSGGRRRSTVRSDCGRASSSVRLRARMSTRSAASPASIRPCRSRPIRSAGVAVTAREPVGAGVVEMQDARRLAEDLEHVEIAIGVERVARVVARDHHGHARRLQFVQRRNAAPARRAAGLPVLQIHVAHRQADDGEARLRDLGDDAAGCLAPGRSEASSNGRRGPCP